MLETDHILTFDLNGPCRAMLMLKTQLSEFLNILWIIFFDQPIKKMTNKSKVSSWLTLFLTSNFCPEVCIHGMKKIDMHPINNIVINIQICS